MRVLVLAIAAYSLAACDTGSVTQDEAQAEHQAPNAPDTELNGVVLRADGMNAGPEAFYFAAGQNEVEASLARTLGKASETGDMEECGAGPMSYSQFPGGLTVNFQDGSLVGWFWDDEAEDIALAGDIAIGAPRAEIEAIDGFERFDDSTLGDEFSIGQGGGGFFEGDKLSVLYAGTQCFFR